MAATVQHLGYGPAEDVGRSRISAARQGHITINGRAFENYFTTDARAMVRQPLLATETADNSMC